jgi:putative aldouronate transport system substrate-binding protein
LKKQLGTIAAVFLVSMFTLAGCGNTTDQKAGNSPVANASNSQTANAPSSDSKSSNLKPYKLVMYYPGSTPQDLGLVQDEISKYLTEKINATIELKPIDWGAYNDKTNLMFTSNEKIDLMFTASYLNYNANVTKGQFLQLDKLLDKYGQGIKDTLGPDWIKGSQVNGHSYGMPTLKEFAGAAGFLFRKDLVDKYHINLDSIKTLADLTPIFQTIKDHEPGVTPLIQSGGLNVPDLIAGYTLDRLGDGIGVIDPAKSDLKVVDLLETKQYTDPVKQMRKWYEAGFINKDAATVKVDQLYSIMKAGKGFAYAEAMKPGKDAEMSTQLGVDLVQKYITIPQTTTGEATGAMLAISRTNGDQERAMMFLNLLYTDKKLLNMLDFGIEGKHYAKNANDVLVYPNGVTAQTSGFNPGTAWMFGNQLNTYMWSNEDPQKWTKYKAFNDSSTKSPALGFVWDPSNVKNEVSAANNVQQEFEGSISTGTIDPDKYITQYIAKLKASGLDKIIAEKQKQLDAWAQSK